MKIGKILPFSTVDELWTPSITIFVSGCNLDCPFCHNHHLIPGRAGTDRNVEYIVNIIRKNSRFAKCVVISGGEPTLQRDLKDVVVAIKKRTNMPVFLNTNGTNFEVLRDVVDVLDGASIDIKTIFPDVLDRYGSDVIETVYKSIRYLSNERRRRPSFKPEVRMVLVEPLIPLATIPLIVESLCAWSYNGWIVLQQFDREHVRDNYLRALTALDIHDVMATVYSLNVDSVNIAIRTLNDGVMILKQEF